MSLEFSVPERDRKGLSVEYPDASLIKEERKGEEKKVEKNKRNNDSIRLSTDP
jgi:hypothetical protein